MIDLTYDQFVLYLRSALHYLYDPVHLRESPLVELLGLRHEFDQAAVLQQTLTAAIRTLKPAADAPPQSRAWRIYDALHFQYVRQMGREAVATQLGISDRQLRREQRVALEVLAQSLWPQIKTQPTTPLTPPVELSLPPESDAEQALSEELGWLKKSTVEPPVGLGEALQTVQRLAQPLAEQWRASLQVSVPPTLLDLAVAPLALRSTLLTLLSVAIPQADCGPVLITAQAGPPVAVTVTCSVAGEQEPLTEKDANSLQTAQNLAAFYGASLSFPSPMDGQFTAVLTLPAPEQVPVLVIDDNSDWLALQQRYAVGSRYQVIGTNLPQEAHALAEKLQPAVILLDVMMHNVDGWQVLSELQHNPATARIPVVICTILPVAELALSLGATAFLQKPVTQHQFLQTLEQQSRLAAWH